MIYICALVYIWLVYTRDIKHRRILIVATPAKWNVFNVICVPGSPIDWAQTAPTAEPGSILARMYLCKHILNVSRNCVSVTRSTWYKTTRKTLNETQHDKYDTTDMDGRLIWSLLTLIQRVPGSKPPSNRSHKAIGENWTALCISKQKGKRNHDVWSHWEEGPGSHCSIAYLSSGTFVLYK